MTGAAGHAHVHPRTSVAWGRWLEQNHDRARGVWLVMYKASTGKRRIPYDDCVVEALRFGWIDSVQKPLDDERTAMLFTPRRPGSGWSRSNKERVARLRREGRMAPAGLAAVAAAKRDGSWTLLDSVEALEVPADLRRALGARGARALASLTPGRQKEHLRALVTARTPGTRAKRVAQVVQAVRAVLRP